MPSTVDLCPACGDDLYVAGYGCPTCGHGRPKSAKVRPGAVAAAAAFATTALGVLLLFTAGGVSRSVAWAHVLLFAMSVPFVAGGVYSLRSPRGLPLARNDGTDAFGMARYAETHASTKSEGLVQGAILLAVGIAMALLGAFLGRLTG